MFYGMTEQEIYSLFGFGIIANFLFSILFGLHMSKNIGIEEMIKVAGDNKQPAWMSFMIFIPFAKMLITLYRVIVLQFMFLNQGKNHLDFWIYLTHKDQPNT